MTDRPPIAVPLDLIENWRLVPEFCDGKKKIVMVTISREKLQFIADQAAQWGADMELEACLQWFSEFYCMETWMQKDLEKFRTARRPKPPSLKELALKELQMLCDTNDVSVSDLAIIRRALESLPS